MNKTNEMVELVEVVETEPVVELVEDDVIDLSTDRDDEAAQVLRDYEAARREARMRGLGLASE